MLSTKTVQKPQTSVIGQALRLVLPWDSSSALSLREFTHLSMMAEAIHRRGQGGFALIGEAASLISPSSSQGLS